MQATVETKNATSHDARELSKQIERAATRVREADNALADVRSKMKTAQKRRNDTAAHLRAARSGEGVDDVAALEQQLAGEDAYLSALREREKTCEQAATVSYHHNDALHRVRRQLEDLGGRAVKPIVLPSWQDDAQRVALVAEERSLAQKVAELEGSVAELSKRAEESADMLRQVRAAADRGRATAQALKQAQTESGAAADAHMKKAAELERLRQALQAARTEREALDAELRHRVVPSLKRAHRAAMREFIQALRTAAVASETVWAYHTALNAEGATPQLCPWPELRVSPDDTKLRYFLREAIELGFLDDEA